jgi:Flp pilus assembly pilin Flp
MQWGMNAFRTLTFARLTNGRSDAPEGEPNMKNYLVTRLRALVRDDEGQDILEYALLVALIALGAVVAIGLAGDSVEAAFTAIADAIGAAV